MSRVAYSQGPLAKRPNPAFPGDEYGDESSGDLWKVLPLPAGLGSWGKVSRKGGSGVGEFVFSDFGTQDPTQGRFTSWTDLMTALASIELGATPIVRLALTTGPFVVPLTGMPANGWDFRGGQLMSFSPQTGSQQITLPSGGKFDNLFGIGGGIGNGSVVLNIDPPAGTGVLEFSALPPGSARIHLIGGGSYVNHSSGAGAYMRGPDDGSTMVLVAAGCQQNTGLAPALSGPLVELGNTDGAVGVQYFTGGLPDNWLVGGGPASALISIYDASANPKTPNPAAWIPGFTGGGPVTAINFVTSSLINYIAGTPAQWAGSAPTNPEDAINRLAAAVFGLLGGPIP